MTASTLLRRAGYSVEYYVAPDCSIFDVRSYGFGVNNSGVVVGKLDGCPQPANERAFVWWPDGVVQVIDVPNSSDDRALDVNDLNQVLLEIVSPIPGFGYVPAIWENGVITIMDIPEWATTGVPAAINELGVIVGEYGNVSVNPYPLACTWSIREGLVDLSEFFDVIKQRPVGITDDGVIAGSTVQGGNNWRAFVLDGEVVTDLGIPAGCVNSIATAISNAGHVVGYGHSGSAPTHPWKGFIWKDGVMSPLSPLPLAGHDEAVARDVNSFGVMVGYSESSGEGEAGRTTIWFDGTPYDLASLVDLPPSSAVTTPRAIADSGVIAGSGSHMGAPRAYRLTPKPVSIADVNIDCHVDGADLAALLRRWGQGAAGLSEDIDGNGVVDGDDLGVLLSEWTG